LDRRQVLKMFGAVAAAGAAGGLSGCGTDTPSGTMEQPSGRTITVGLIAPAVGAYRKMGDDITKGFKLYLEDHANLLGRHYVNLITEDEGNSADTTTAAVGKLLKESPIALAGIASPTSLTAAANAVESAKVPLVTAAAAPTALTNKLFVWRVSQVEGEAGRALGPYARGEGTTAYVIRDDTGTSQQEAREFRDSFAEAGGQVIGESVGTGGYAGRLQQARNSGASSIFASYSGNDALAMLQAFRASGIVDRKLLGPGSLTETTDLSKLGRMPDRVYTAMYYAPDVDNEVNRRFVSSYHKKHGVQPSAYAVAAHDCASVLDKALRLMGEDLTPAALNRAFSLLGQMESPRGIWAFNINRTPQQKWFLRRLRFDGQVAANMLDADLAVLS
jgi:branched-chain amino acid transport system substrate-binding protein